jgi:RNA polymerase sigma factor (sigma-70 family)
MLVTPPSRFDAKETAELAVVLRPALVSFFRRRCGHTDEAEDLAQEVILRALQHPELQSAEHAKHYVFRIAENCWRDRGRRKVVREDWTLSHAGNYGGERIDELTPERRTISADEFERIVKALQTLDERTRRIFILCRFEQMKQAEVATAFNLSLSTVEKELARAIAHLVACLK